MCRERHADLIKERNVQKFSELMRGNDLIVAPVALSPIMARLAEEAGFKAVYLSGGSLGWLKCVTEANLTLPELAAVALDMRAVCRLPVVLDAGRGWGDPVHLLRPRPPPLMPFAPPDGFSGFPFSPHDLAGLGYRLAASSGTAFAAMVKAVRQSYECLAQGRIDPFLGPGGADKEMKAAQTTSGLERLLQIERRTMKDH